MSFRLHLIPAFIIRMSSEDKKAFQLQAVVVVLVISLLELGYSWQRELIAIANHNHLQRIIHGWDGLAWYIWVLAAPATLVLIRRYPLERGLLPRNLLRLAVGSFLIYFGVTNGRYLLRLIPNIWLPDEGDLPLDWATFRHTQMVLLPLDFITFCCIFATSSAIDSFVKYRKHAQEVDRLNLRAAQLNTDLANAQLAVLRGQLQPHFLFNAFNAIATLVRQRRSEMAIETIAELSGLFRLAIEQVNCPMQTLAQELEFVTRYLNVERVRFGSKLQVVQDIDHAALVCFVPSFLLQPLVENAIKHGISRRLNPGQVLLSIRRREQHLHITILNDRPEIAADPLAWSSPGIGLSNTRERLAAIYGQNYQLTLEEKSPEVTSVFIGLPWREQSSRVSVAKESPPIYSHALG